MVTRIIAITAAVLLATTASALAGTASPRATDRDQDQSRRLDLRALRQLRGDPAPAAARSRHSLIDDRVSPASLLSTLDADTMPSPGIAIGITSYDIQHYASQGHQVASVPGSETVHFAWTMWDVIQTSYQETNRFVQYNSWDKPSGSLNQGFNGVSITLGDFARGGFVRIDVDADNLCHATLHQLLEEDYPYSVWHQYYPIEGSALHYDDELQRNSLFYYELDHLFPDITVGQTPGGGDGDVVHVISTGSADFGGYVDISDHIWYYRYDAGAPVPMWVGPVLIDSSRDLSFVIDADDDSGKVAIAFTSDYSTDGFNEVNNVAYRESHNSGASWIDGSGLGELNKHFATTFADPNGTQAWTEASVAYNHHSCLHLIFLVQRFANATEQMAIYHWSSQRSTIRPVTTAYYDNPATWYRSLNLSQISLGVGDGATACFGGSVTNEDFLYVLYTKLGGETPAEQEDTSKLGYANGELYLTVSPDGGGNWSAPVNLTNTKTPDCTSLHPDSTCASEAWATIARDVSDIEILYIRDYEPNELQYSGWTMNKVMYLSYPGGTADDPFLCPGTGCYCPCHADPLCDGATNILDVVYAVDVAFRDAPAVFHFNCLVSRTDVDCSEATDILDVVHFVNIAFRGGDPDAEFCDPCAP